MTAPAAKHHLLATLLYRSEQRSGMQFVSLTIKALPTICIRPIKARRS
ncbi:hypothetical protein [Paenibacillus dendritiformis]